MNKLVGITGLAGAGKDSAAAYLIENHNFKKVAFANPIRAGMKAMLGLDDKHFEHPDKEIVLPEFGKSPRQMMQTLGSDWGRDLVHENLWLLLANKEIYSLRCHYNVVVTDVRFNNEAKEIRAAGGEIWHISRPNATTTPHAHASENGVEFVTGDCNIENEIDLEYLYDQVELLLKISAEETATQEASDLWRKITQALWKKNK